MFCILRTAGHLGKLKINKKPPAIGGFVKFLWGVAVLVTSLEVLARKGYWTKLSCLECRASYLLQEYLLAIGVV